ncbi:MAG: hypothetical protein JJU29_05520 [Verrucomicrobia bacterium]|nr:hypothetical protein [Verrucomicrobiota bacterium]
MKKLFIAFQWLVLLAAAAGLGWLLFRPTPKPRHEPEIWQHWQGFHVLSYEGINDSGDPRYVSRERLAEQLHALQDAGWETMTDQDALQFLRHKHPLPEKALLLIFEGGRKDNVIRATPLLRETGLIAHLALPTSVTKTWGNHFLKSNEVRSLSKDPFWHLISMGHDAIQQVPVDSEGTRRNFLSHRAWINGAPESDEAYRQRLHKDFSRAALDLQYWTGGIPLAYLFPYTDTGGSAGADVLAASLLHTELTRWHTLAFTDEGDSFNHHSANPLRLSRLRVRGDWSGHDLLNHMEAFSTFLPKGPDAPHPLHWRGQGITHPETRRLILPPEATLSLNGAKPWPDFRWDFTPHVPRGGKLELHLRYHSPPAHIRITLETHRIQVHEKNRGPMIRLADIPLPNPSPHHQILLKNNRLRIDADGAPLLSPTPVQVLSSGQLFLTSLEEPCEVSNWKFSPLEPLYLSGENLSALTQRELDHVVGVFFPLPPDSLSAALTDWVKLTAKGLHTIPVLEAESASADLDRLIQARREHPALETLITRVALPANAQPLHQTARDAGLKLYMLADPDDTLPTLGSNDHLVFRPSETDAFPPAALQGPPWQRMVEANQRGQDWPPELKRLQRATEIQP